MDESGQYGIYQRSFRYGKVPEFVKSTFGTDTGIDAAEPGVCVLKKLPGVDSGMQKIDFLPRRG